MAREKARGREWEREECHTSMPTDESSCCFEPDFLVVGDFGSAAADAVDIMDTSASPFAIGEVGAAAVDAADLRGGMLGE